MKRATKIQDVSEKFAGTAHLYKMVPPVPYNMDWATDEYLDKTEYVVSSGAVAMFSGAETYLFPTDKEGNVLNWGELDGSFRGACDCDEAIRNAGYTIVESDS